MDNADTQNIHGNTPLPQRNLQKDHAPPGQAR